MSRVAPGKPRLAYLDLTKGILVLLMVVYHSLNYTNQYHLAFRYLSFLPLSFILITGFLISQVYFPRYVDGDRTLVTRLIVRGSRLLVLFIILNVVAQFVRSPTYGQSVGVGAFFRNWEGVFLVGGSRVAAFEVLLPIAYLLLLAPGLIATAHRLAAFLPLTALLLVGACGIMDYRGTTLPNLNFLTVGIVGMLAGRWLTEPGLLGRYLWWALLAYLAYFPLGMARGWIFLVQFLGALLALTLICAATLRIGEKGWWHRRVIRIGQYSLVAYIAQIGLLQLLSRLVGRPDPISLGSSILFTATLVLMSLAIEATEWLRGRMPSVDRTYKAVFA